MKSKSFEMKERFNEYVEAVNPVELARVAEQEFQYGAEAFEVYQQGMANEMTESKKTKNVFVKNSR